MTIDVRQKSGFGKRAIRTRTGHLIGHAANAESVTTVNVAFEYCKTARRGVFCFAWSRFISLHLAWFRLAVAGGAKRNGEPTCLGAKKGKIAQGLQFCERNVDFAWSGFTFSRLSSAFSPFFEAARKGKVKIGRELQNPCIFGVKSVNLSAFARPLFGRDVLELPERNQRDSRIIPSGWRTFTTAKNRNAPFQHPLVTANLHLEID